MGERRALLVSDTGARLESERDAADLIGDAIGADAALVLVPAARLGDDFFQLNTRKAGLFIQKFANYRLR
jgi:hypothetical protein